MAEPKFLTDVEPRSAIGDWTVRGGVALFFFIFGTEKFSADPGSHWVLLFQQIGAGAWFRYFTGVVEVLGALLVLIPRTALAGLVILALTMAAAAIIMIFAIANGGGIIDILICVFLTMMAWRRWKS